MTDKYRSRKGAEIGLKDNKAIIYELNIEKDRYTFPDTILDAIIDADEEMKDLESKLNETLESIRLLTPECDKMDYGLSVSSGALCGIIDVFLVGKPGESLMGNITDKWFANRVTDFAKICGYNGNRDSLSSVIKFLENKFNVPYDQSVGGETFRELINLTPSNHHFKSLAHNPTLLGLFFSILNQFNNSSDFVSNGELISLNNSDGEFELRGKNIPGKLFCGIANWIGHLISDVSGNSKSKGRGMGIPSPIWAWSNDVITIKRQLNIPVNEFDKSVNELALNLFIKGYDVRFQTTQAIPVFINEMIVRFLYSTRRLIKYYINVPRAEQNWELLWKSCEPFSNATVKRMLTAAHGTFCLIDIGDVAIRGLKKGAGGFNVTEFFMRLNIVGVGRFTISLYGEAKRGIQRIKLNNEMVLMKQEKEILDTYIEGLKILSDIYNDELLLTFINDLKSSNAYKEAFDKSVKLAELRNVPDNKIIKSKADIDCYFRGGLLR